MWPNLSSVSFLSFFFFFITLDLLLSFYFFKSFLTLALLIWCPQWPAEEMKKSPQGFGGGLPSCGRPLTFLYHCQGCCAAVSPSLEILFSRFSKIHSVDWNFPCSIEIDCEHWFWKANTGERPPAGKAMPYWQRHAGCYDIWSVSFLFLISQKQIPRLVRLLLNLSVHGTFTSCFTFDSFTCIRVNICHSYFSLVFHVSSILFLLFFRIVTKKISNFKYLRSLSLAFFRERGSRGGFNVLLSVWMRIHVRKVKEVWITV